MVSETGKPVALFLCVHNAGRSQMALGWFNHLAGDDAVAWSGGSEPGAEVNPSAVAAMAEVGIDIATEFPKPWTDEIVRAADVVITMGCGDACPIFPGKRYLDWDLADPAGQSVEAVRPIRENPQELENCRKLIKPVRVNQQSLDTFKAESKDHLLGNLDQIYLPESDAVLLKQLTQLAAGAGRYESEIPYLTLEEDRIWANLVVSIPPGYENNWTKVLISIMDITEQKTDSTGD